MSTFRCQDSWQLHHGSPDPLRIGTGNTIKDGCFACRPVLSHELRKVTSIIVAGPTKESIAISLSVNCYNHYASFFAATTAASAKQSQLG